MGQTSSRSSQDITKVGSGSSLIEESSAQGAARMVTARRVYSRPASPEGRSVGSLAPGGQRDPKSRSAPMGQVQPADEATPLKWAEERAARWSRASSVSRNQKLAPCNPMPEEPEGGRLEGRIWSVRLPVASPACCCCCRCAEANCEHDMERHQAGLYDEVDCFHGYCASPAGPQQFVDLASERTSTDYQTFAPVRRPLDVENDNTSEKPAARLNEIGTTPAAQVSSAWEQGGGRTKRRPLIKSAKSAANVSSCQAWTTVGRAPLQPAQLCGGIATRQQSASCSPFESHLKRQTRKCSEPAKLVSGQTTSCGRCECGGHKLDSCRSSPSETTEHSADFVYADEGRPVSDDGARGSVTTPATSDNDNGIKSGDHNRQGDKTAGDTADDTESGKASGKNQVAVEALNQEDDVPKLYDNSASKEKLETVNRQQFRQSAQPRRPTNHLAWNELALKYGRMSRRGQERPPAMDAGFEPDKFAGAGQPYQEEGAAANCGPGWDYNRQPRAARKTGSCFYHIVCALAQTLFPILGAFDNYALPADLLTDLAAGFTVAVLHIPQGMAYGLLSGVEPIYGLYVSFIPVAVMSLMSKSRHASYGTFAIISMLLLNTISKARASFKQDQLGSSNASLPLVITDNHQPLDAAQSQHRSQLLRQIVVEHSPLGPPATQPPAVAIQNLLVDASPLMDGAELNSGIPSNIEILTCVCLVCGVLHITMSLLRLGILSLMFSDQLVSSFTTAGAIHVFTSQLAGLFDMSLAPITEELFKCARIWWQFSRALVQGDFNQTTALLSLASVVFLLAVKELLEPHLRRRFTKLTCLPSELVLMVVLVCCSSYYRLAADFNVKIIGLVPTGLPEPKAPNLELVPYVLKDSIGIALITFAINLSIAQVYAKKFRYELNANQELFALGSANLVGSFFSCFPCASSLSRSSVQSNLNAKSQLCSLFSCCIVFTIVCYFAHILHDLPKSTLSCIIVVALKGILMQVRDFYDNWRLSKLDAAVWIITFVSVIVFGVTFGLVLGIMASLFMIFFRLLTPNHSVLGRLPGTEIYVDKDAFAECEEIEHVKIFRFNSALCYLNRTILKSKIEKLLPTVFEPSGFRAICSQFHADQLRAAETAANRTNYLVVDCSALSYCDYSGVATLIELIDDLADRKVCVLLASCPLKLVDMIERMQRGADILARNVYPTISDAIGQVQYLQAAAFNETKTRTLSLAGDSSRRQSSRSEAQQQQKQQRQSSPSDGTNSRTSIIDVP